MTDSNNVIPFKRKSEANTEPYIWSDYFGSDSIPIMDILEALERCKNDNKDKL